MEKSGTLQVVFLRKGIILLPTSVIIARKSLSYDHSL